MNHEVENLMSISLEKAFADHKLNFNALTVEQQAEVSKLVSQKLNKQPSEYIKEDFDIFSGCDWCKLGLGVLVGAVLTVGIAAVGPESTVVGAIAAFLGVDVMKILNELRKDANLGKGEITQKLCHLFGAC